MTEMARFFADKAPHFYLKVPRSLEPECFLGLAGVSQRALEVMGSRRHMHLIWADEISEIFDGSLSS
jgi:hypothetical protein